jgi:hypothetical protein
MSEDKGSCRANHLEDRRRNRRLDHRAEWCRPESDVKDGGSGYSDVTFNAFWLAQMILSDNLLNVPVSDSLMLFINLITTIVISTKLGSVSAVKSPRLRLLGVT